MKKAVLLLLLSVIGFCGTISAQLTGTKNIPGDYATLALAVNALNTQGVGAGGVVFNLLAGNPQTAPAGGYALTIATSTSTAANPVTFTGNGNTITASASLTAGALNDAIFKIVGADYVTIQGFIMQENPSNVNTTPGSNTMTEWGVALLYASATNGAQYNTITGNTISLNRTYTNTWGVYSNTRHTATAVTGTADITALTGSNSYNSVLQNTISNVCMGIAFIGSNNVAYQDQGNVIGSATQGNSISNWGGAAATSGYVSNSGTSYGILMNHQLNCHVRGNTLSTTTTTTVTIRGIFLTFTSVSPTQTATNSICRNTITISSSAASGTLQMIGVASGSATLAMVVDSNLFSNCAVTGASSGIVLTGISMANALQSVSVRHNAFMGCTSTATTGGFSGIAVSSAISGNSTISDNQFGNSTTNAVTFSAAVNSAVTAIAFTGSAGSTGVRMDISGNVFHGFIFITTAGSSATVTMIQLTGSLPLSYIENNNFLTLALNASAAITLINNNAAGTSTSQAFINGNFITGGLTRTSATGSAMTMISGTGSSAAGAARIITNNDFSGVSGSNSDVNGIVETGGAASGAVKRTVTGNVFSNWSGNLLSLITLGNSGATSAISNNTISNVSAASSVTGISFLGTCNGAQDCFSNSITGITTAGSFCGVLISGTPTFSPLRIADNVIGNVVSSGASADVEGISLAGGGIEAYRNTIYDLHAVTSVANSTNGMLINLTTDYGTAYANKIYGIENTAGTAKGMYVQNCTTLDIYNNYIGDIAAPNTTGNAATVGIDIAAGTTANVSHNTVYLRVNAAGTNTGSAAFRASASTALTLRNNLFVNHSTQTGSGLVTAYTRTSTSLANYAAASNANSFYAGTPSASHLIFHDGTNADQTLAQYKLRVGPTTDAASLSENPTFVSTTGSNSGYLHIPAGTAMLLESGGVTIAAITTDWDGDVRPGPVGSVNGGASAPDIGADEFDGVPLNCGTPVAGTATTSSPVPCATGTFALALTGHSTGPAFTYQWQEATVSGGPYTNIAGATSPTYTTTAISSTMYYVCVVTCSASGLSATSTEVACVVNPAPAINVSASSGSICAGSFSMLSATGASVYTWMPGALTGASVIVSPSATTTYTVTGDDGNGCTATATITINVLPRPVVSITGASSYCQDGSTVLIASAGATWQWYLNGVQIPGAVSQTHTATSPGIYNVLVALPSSCADSAATGHVLTENASPAVAFTASPSLTVCENTSATLSGTGAASYTWSGGITDGVAFTAVATTSYTVTGTDGNGCTNTATATVTVNTLPAVNFIAAPASSVCAGNPVTLSGTGAATYAWTGGVTDAVAFTPVTTQTYTVTGTDGNGCSNTNTVTITVNPLPSVSFTAAPALTVCTGSSVTLSGTGAATYSWSGGITDGVAFVPASSQTYTVIGTDANGCTATATANVVVNPTLVVGFTALPSAAVCTGTSVTLSGTGGTSYAWSGGVTDGVPFTPTATQTYTVTGTDASGCTGTTTVTITVNPLPTVGASASPSTTVCAGSSVTLSGSGASAYTWSGGVTDGIAFNPPASATYTVTGTDNNGCTNTATIVVTVNPAPTVGVAASPSATVCAGSSVTLSGTGATSYAWSGGITDGVAFIPFSTTTYTVTGANGSGCTSTATITVTVNPLPTIGSTASPASTVCTGTMVTLNGTGGTSYTWSGGVTNGVAFTATSTQTYTVTGTDANGCSNTATTTITVNPLPTVTTSATPATTVCSGTPVTLNGNGATTYTWSNGVTNGVPFTPSASATYTVTGSDAFGCTATATITIVVNPLPSISATATPATPICAGTSVVLNGSGGVSYAWSNGVVNGVAFNPSATQTYTVIGTDANGCTNTATATVVVNPVPSITTSASPSSTVCAGTTVTLNAFGASSYVWSGGITDGVPFTATATTTYTVTGTDMNGCTGAATVTVTVDALPNINAAQSPGGPHCAGSTVTLNGIGGVSYTWCCGITNGVGFVPASTATYTVTGTGFNGCTNTNTITVVVNPRPTVASTTAPATTVCSGTPVTLSGTGAATYTWSGGVTNGVPFTPTATTTYTVTGTAANGCTNTATVTITVNPTPTVSSTAAPSNAVCAGSPVTLSGTGAVSYTWSGGVTNGVAFTPLATTTYTVTGTGANGCTNTATTTVVVNPLPAVGTNATPSTLVCSGTPVILNGTGAATYVWTGGVQDNVPFMASTTNTYTVTGTDANGCVATAVTTVTVNISPTVSYVASPGINICYGTELTLDGTGAVTYTWSDSISDGAPFIPLVSDTVTVVGMDGNGCVDSVTFVITVNTPPVVTATVTPRDTVCKNTPLTLAGAGASTYVWSHGVVNNVPFAANTSATYTVIGTDTNGCSDTTTQAVTVLPAPVVSIMGNSTFCIGGNSVLTSSAGVSYQWYKNGAPIAGQTSVAYTATTAGVYNVWVTNTNGCGDSAATGVNITINTPPVVTANTTANAICRGSSVTLTGGGAASYAWSGGVNNGVPFSPLNTLTYTVVGTASNGCTASNTVTVVVNALPVVSSVATPGYTVCENTAVTLSGTGAATYVWTGGIMDGVPFNAASTTTYTVTGTDVNGCTGTATATLTVNPYPVVDIGPDSSRCGGAVLLNAGNAGATYLWNTTATTQTLNAATSGTYIVNVTVSGCTTADTVTITINTQPVVLLGTDVALCTTSITLDAMNPGGTYLWNDMSTGQQNVVTASGTYFVEVTMPGGCTASDTIQVVLNTPPVVTLSLPLDTACLNMGAVALGGESPAGGTWSGPAVSGATFNPMIAGIGTFGITYNYTDANGCSGSATDSILVDACLAIEEAVAVADFTMYPNPNNGEFSILLNGNETAQAFIYNAAGQIVLAEQVRGGERTLVSLDASGIYMVTLVMPDGQQVTKRVVVNW